MTIEVKNLEFAYKKSPVLKGVDFSAKPVSAFLYLVKTVRARLHCFAVCWVFFTITRARSHWTERTTGR